MKLGIGRQENMNWRDILPWGMYAILGIMGAFFGSCLMGVAACDNIPIIEVLAYSFSGLVLFCSGLYSLGRAIFEYRAGDGDFL